MTKKNILRIFLIIFLCFIILFIYLNVKKKNLAKVTNNNSDELTENNYESTNSLVDVTYESRDTRGNIYTLSAKKGEFDLSQSNIVFLEDVKSTIILNNLETINISSDFGKYNAYNYDTIFSKNVLIKYSNYEITGNYIDLSLTRNSMIISKNVVFVDGKRRLKTDVVEIDIETKDIKIFMNDQNERVNIQTIN